MCPSPGTGAAAEHPPDIPELMEATQTINITTGTAAIRMIRDGIETRANVIVKKTTENRDSGNMVISETEEHTDFIQTALQVRSAPRPEAAPCPVVSTAEAPPAAVL